MQRRKTAVHLGRVLDFYVDESLNEFGRFIFLSKHEVHHNLYSGNHFHSLFCIFSRNFEI